MGSTFLLDERIKTLVELLPESAMEQDNESNNTQVEMSGKISFMDIERLSKKHFPLCMQEVKLFFSQIQVSNFISRCIDTWFQDTN